MYKILGIKPVSIAGSLIINGLIKGFEQTQNQTLLYDIDKLDLEIIREFNPDFAIGYDYAHFMSAQAEYIINELNIPVIHYFADDPDSSFSHCGDQELYKKLSQSGNLVFCWDKELLSQFPDKSFYLPLAVDTDLYHVKKNLSYDIPEIVFTGRPLTLRRLDILTCIFKNFPEKLNIYSYEKHFNTSVEEIKQMNLLDKDQLDKYKNCYKGFLKNEQELAQVYNSAKIVLNITMEQGVSSMNYRILETLASEGFLITDYRKDIASYFNNGEDLIFYSNNDELIEKISYFLTKGRNQAEKIARNGRKNIIMSHTFKQRAEKILNILKLN